MALGRGSTKQKLLNTRSSTEAELVGVNDSIALVLWTRMFLEAQGFIINNNIIYQDNQSAILLEKNGRRSSGKKTRHIEIRYYFITDNIARGTTQVHYCPTKEMWCDFFTKPVQGTLFREFKSWIMNDGIYPYATDRTQECVGAPMTGSMNGPSSPASLVSDSNDIGNRNEYSCQGSYRDAVIGTNKNRTKK